MLDAENTLPVHTPWQ